MALIPNPLGCHPFLTSDHWTATMKWCLHRKASMVNLKIWFKFTQMARINFCQVMREQHKPIYFNDSQLMISSFYWKFKSDEAFYTKDDPAKVFRFLHICTQFLNNEKDEKWQGKILHHTRDRKFRISCFLWQQKFTVCNI